MRFDNLHMTNTKRSGKNHWREQLELFNNSSREIFMLCEEIMQSKKNIKNTNEWMHGTENFNSNDNLITFINVSKKQ
jgi:hypothetical protein